MSDFEPRRIPAGTTQITYTAGDGTETHLEVQQLEPGYAYVEPRDAAEATVLDGFGYTTVARKVLGEAEEEETPTVSRRARTTTTPAQAPVETTGPDAPAQAEEG